MSPRGNRCSAVPHPRVVEQFPTNLLRAATGVEGVVPAQRLCGVCGGARGGRGPLQKRAKRLSRKNQHGADWRGSP